jgi:hypothetical protein
MSLIIFPVLLVAGSASAPTEYRCTVQKVGTPLVIDVVTDQGNMVVSTTSLKTGYSERREARFTPEAVMWSTPGLISFNYTLNRTDLSIARETRAPHVSVVDRGTCTLRSIPAPSATPEQ